MTELDREDLAAGYALGFLDATDRAAAERLVRDDPDFADLVMRWETRLAPLSEALDPLAPPATVWDGISAALPARAAAATQSASSLGAEVEKLRHRLAFWRVSAIGGSLAALLLAAVWLGGLLGTDATAERYVAMLNSQQGETGFLVTVDASAAKLLIRSLGAAPPKSKAYELWLMKDDGSVPKTLGIVQPGKFVTLDMASDMPKDDWEAGPKLAISLEPPEGAPSGRAMGPIVYAGSVIRQTR